MSSKVRTDAYKVIITASRERFMENPIMETSEHYFLADSKEEAIRFAKESLLHGGWIVSNVEAKSIVVFDLSVLDKEEA